VLQITGSFSATSAVGLAGAPTRCGALAILTMTHQGRE
jgi:hypothetical protein